MGQMGARLSGGERQRVGIARTMLVNPDVIVMDEPTSSLDVLHEKELLQTLREECGDKMLLIVSHRPSTLTGCNRVVCLENGAADESGKMKNRHGAPGLKLYRMNVGERFITRFCFPRSVYKGSLCSENGVCKEGSCMYPLG